jgi:hypothetical protein
MQNLPLYCSRVMDSPSPSGTIERNACIRQHTSAYVRSDGFTIAAGHHREKRLHLYNI